MEADHFGLYPNQCVAHDVIERHSIGDRNLRGRVDAELVIVASKAIFPFLFPGAVRLRSSMTKEVEIDRSRRALTNSRHGRDDLVGRQHRAWQGTEATSLGDSDCEFSV